jgi:hypothetical protein
MGIVDRSAALLKIGYFPSTVIDFSVRAKSKSTTMQWQWYLGFGHLASETWSDERSDLTK